MITETYYFDPPEDWFSPFIAGAGDGCIEGHVSMIQVEKDSLGVETVWVVSIYGSYLGASTNPKQTEILKEFGREFGSTVPPQLKTYLEEALY